MPVSPVICLVDDSKDQLELLVDMLAITDYTVKEYSSGIEFLQKKEFAEIGCVLLDNQMPYVSGLDVQRRMKKQKINLPIVFISGGSQYSDVVDVVKEGALGFLQKPFTRTALIKQIENAIAESQKRLKLWKQKSNTARKLQPLTSREIEIYDLVRAGYTNKVISKSLSITVKIVEFHRSNLMQKLAVGTLAELMAVSH